MGRPTDAVGGVFDTLGHSNGPYCTRYGDQAPQNERIKACVGSMTATNYARNWSDCMHFHLYVIRRPTDAVRGIFDALGHSNGPYCTYYRGPDTPKRAYQGMCWVHEGK